MLLIIPSIDILNGKCVYKILGEQGTDMLYSEIENNPEKLCKLFRKENVKSIHVTDLDSYSTADYHFENIFKLTKATFLPFQLQAHFYDLKHCNELLNNGIHRLVLDDVNDYDVWDLRNLLLKYTNHRIIFSVPVKGNFVRFEYSNKSYPLIDYMEKIHALVGMRVIYKEMNLPEKTYYVDDNLDILKYYVKNITLSADISDYQELIKMNEIDKYGFDSVIIGKPFYENSFSCQKIWRLIESEVDI
jgi:phosphoribosylformimino-5-aminoimidazole carboxamide ribotide isomerase